MRTGKQLELDVLGKTEEAPESLPELPKGWRWVKLAGVLTRKPQYGLTAKSSAEKRGILYIRISDLTDSGELKSEDLRFVEADPDTLRKYGLESEDILIARSGSVGRAYLHKDLGRPCVFASYLIRFKLHRQSILPEFFFYYALSSLYKSFIETTLRIMAQPNINATELCRLPVPLPQLKEQKRIVARIEEILPRVEQAKKLREEALEEAEAILQSCLRETFRRADREGWPKHELGRLVAIGAKQVDPTLDAFRELPHINGENIESGTCRLLTWQTTAEDRVRSGNYLFRPGSVLYSKIRPYLRKVTFVEFGGLCSADVYPLEIRSPDLDAHFLMWSLVAEPFTHP